VVFKTVHPLALDRLDFSELNSRFAKSLWKQLRVANGSNLLASACLIKSLKAHLQASACLNGKVQVEHND
jgi:hypothetical protein